MNKEKLSVETYRKNRMKIQRIIKELLSIDIEYNQVVARKDMEKLRSSMKRSGMAISPQITKSDLDDEIDELDLLREFQVKLCNLRIAKNSRRKYKDELAKKINEDYKLSIN